MMTPCPKLDIKLSAELTMKEEMESLVEAANAAKVFGKDHPAVRHVMAQAGFPTTPEGDSQETAANPME